MSVEKLLLLAMVTLGGAGVGLLACKPAGAQSRIRPHQFISGTDSGPREVRVAVPPGYEASTIGYPVIYLLDGGSNLEHTVQVVDYLAAQSRIPELIVVAVHNVNRELDMTPPWMKGFSPLPP